VFTVVKGDASPAEIAALVAVLTARQAAAEARQATARAKAVNPRFRPRWRGSNRGSTAPAPGEVAGGSGWSDRSALLRTPLSHGPGAWRASGRPG
jgi:spermidine/putrescine-binding protein